MPHFRLVWVNYEGTVAEPTTSYHETPEEAAEVARELEERYRHGSYVVQEDDDFGNFPPAYEVLRG